MNPLKKNIPSQIKLQENTLVIDLNLFRISHIKDTYIDVTDQNGQSVGAIRKDLLTYILQKQESCHFISFLEEMNEAVVAIDNQKRIFFVNKAYHHILGVPAGKVLGKYLNTIEPDAQLLDVLDTGQPAKAEAKLIKTINKYVSTRMYPILQNGNIIGAFSIFTDNTQLQNMSQKIRQLSHAAQNYNDQLTSMTVKKKLNVIGEDPVFLKCVENNT